ncbi:Uncharacterised protein [Candidatus Anstonella stagnisolia]|nr:Uncharacterised protein [Candidatus Anstonella stagnisolia]
MAQIKALVTCFGMNERAEAVIGIRKISSALCDAGCTVEIAYTADKAYESFIKSIQSGKKFDLVVIGPHVDDGDLYPRVVASKMKALDPNIIVVSGFCHDPGSCPGLNVVIGGRTGPRFEPPPTGLFDYYIPLSENQKHELPQAKQNVSFEKFLEQLPNILDSISIAKGRRENLRLAPKKRKPQQHTAKKQLKPNVI